MQLTSGSRAHVGLVAAFVALLMVTLSWVPVSAQQSTDDPGGGQTPIPGSTPDRDDPGGVEPEVTERLAPVVVVLDGSGSMQGKDPSGGTKLSNAKAALKALIDSLPEDVQIGLVTYGGKQSSSSNQRTGCRDIETVFPVGTLNAGAMKSAVDGLDAKGWTPIGRSLQHAAKELPDDGLRSVVLVSDGEETCAPPAACDAAEGLDDVGQDLVVHSVGFGVEAKARSELQCISKAGAGEYIEAPDGKSLKEKLPLIIQRALRAYEAEGTQVTGTETLNGAPLLGPGQFADRFDAGETRYYQVNIPEGMTVHAAATVILPDDGGKWGTQAATFNLQLINREEGRCAKDHQVASDTTWSPHITAAVSASLDADEDCYTEDGQYFLRVERGTSKRTLGEKDVEILVAYEPPVTAEHGQTQTDAVSFSAPGGKAQEVPAGSSFNNARLLPESGIYTGDIGFGEALFYRVPVQWGQGLSYQVHIGNLSKNSAGLKAIASLRTTLYNPVRRGDFDLGDSDAYTGKPKQLDPVSTAQVYHGNRELTADEIEAASLAGDYYIMVRLEPDKWGDNERATVPIELTVHIDGDPVEPPAYAAVGEYPGELMYEDPTEPEADDGEGGAVGEQGEAVPEGGDDVADDDVAATGGESSLNTPILIAAGGLGLLVLFGIVVMLLLVRRRNTPRSPAGPGPYGTGSPY